MYSSVGRTALRASRRQFTQATRRTYAAEAQSGHPEDRAAGTQALKKGAKRDPELMVWHWKHPGRARETQWLGNGREREITKS